MADAWAPSALRGLPFSSGRASGGGDARAAAMLKLGRAVAGAVAGLVCEGLPPPPEVAHWPTMVLVLRGGAGGGGAAGVPVPGVW